MSVIGNLATEIFSDEFDSDTGVVASGSIEAWPHKCCNVPLNRLVYP